MTQSNQESPAPAKDVGGIRTSPVDPSPTAATTERTHDGQGQHVAAHTPGPWAVSYDSRYTIKAGGVKLVLADIFVPDEVRHANAARIVACVNACEGVSDPAAMVQAFRKEIEIARALRSRVAELEAALRPLMVSVEVALEDAEAEHFFGERNLALVKAEVKAAARALSHSNGDAK